MLLFQVHMPLSTRPTQKCVSKRTTMYILLDPWTIVVITTEIVEYAEFFKMKLCNIRVGRSPNQFEDSLESKCTR